MCSAYITNEKDTSRKKELTSIGKMFGFDIVIGKYHYQH